MLISTVNCTKLTDDITLYAQIEAHLRYPSRSFGRQIQIGERYGETVTKT